MSAENRNICFHGSRDVLSCFTAKMHPCHFCIVKSPVFTISVILVQVTVKHLCESTGARISTIKHTMRLLLRLRIFDFSSQLMCKSSSKISVQTRANTCYASSISHPNSSANILRLRLSAHKPWPTPNNTSAHILHALTIARVLNYQLHLPHTTPK